MMDDCMEREEMVQGGQGKRQADWKETVGSRIDILQVQDAGSKQPARQNESASFQKKCGMFPLSC